MTYQVLCQCHLLREIFPETSDWLKPRLNTSYSGTKLPSGLLSALWWWFPLDLLIAGPWISAAQTSLSFWCGTHSHSFLINAEHSKYIIGDIVSYKKSLLYAAFFIGNLAWKRILNIKKYIFFLKKWKPRSLLV